MGFSYFGIMKKHLFSLTCLFALACHSPADAPAGATPASPDIQGTWRLITGTVTTKGVAVVTDYTKGVSFIKVRDSAHFAFLKHDLNPPKDSSNHFDAGGGAYSLKGDQYTEHLDYYSDHQYEGQSYTFTVGFHGDTLVQQGMEGADRENVERYVRVK
jgi:hypothetical protein